VASNQGHQIEHEFQTVEWVSQSHRCVQQVHVDSLIDDLITNAVLKTA